MRAPAVAPMFARVMPPCGSDCGGGGRFLEWDSFDDRQRLIGGLSAAALVGSGRRTARRAVARAQSESARSRCSGFRLGTPCRSARGSASPPRSRIIIGSRCAGNEILDARRRDRANESSLSRTGSRAAGRSVSRCRTTASAAACSTISSTAGIPRSTCPTAAATRGPRASSSTAFGEPADACRSC